jgi:electron transfer flavoprotein alpha subunit
LIIKNLDVWVLLQQRQGSLEESTFGLLAEARRLAGDTGKVAVVGLWPHLADQTNALGPFGADRIICVEHPSFDRYDGESFAPVLSHVLKRWEPDCLLMAHSPETSDLAPRIAAMLGAGLATRAMDFRINEEGEASAIRPVANGYVFEEIRFKSRRPWLVTFLPAVLSPDSPNPENKAEMVLEKPVDMPEQVRTRLESVIDADPETLDLEEADIIVSGGRGMGKGESFQIVHELAKALGGSVGGTRPVIDWQTLPFERQIGQTGKSVAPRLLFACGISGANEYTTGMEKTQRVVAVNKDPRARIFRFADLGVVGDAHEILPLLVKRLKEDA